MADIVRPAFPTLVDSSMRAAFTACPRKFELQYLHHWAPVAESVHLHAGGAFARGLEVVRREAYGKGTNPETAIALGAKALIEEWGDYEPPVDSNKTLPNMLGALSEYFHHYGIHTDHIQPYMFAREPAVEFSFALPIDVTHPETGDPLLYGGRFDMLGVFQDNLLVLDEKTTTQLGPTWFKNWKLRGQLTGYVWGAKQFGLPVIGAIIRGLAILTRDWKHAEVIQYRTDWEIERWYRQICRDFERMKQCWQEGYFDYDLDSSCSSYGGCEFLDVCSSRYPEDWLREAFVKREWHPLRADPSKGEVLARG